MKLRTTGAWTTAGVAVWVSLGTLDVTSGPSGAERVAMLPGLGPLAACVGLALVLGALLRVRIPTGEARPPTPAGAAAGRPGSGDSFLPLYALSVLALPYLPWLPDWLPVVRVFAGPGRMLVWLIVASQVVWAILGAGRGRRIVVRLRSWSPLRGFAVLFVAGTLLFGAASVALVSSGLFPGGDEPHYLIVTQSLWLDHDLRIDNNHARRDYAPYYDGDLDPHAIAPGKDGGTYSVHPIGLPLLAVPAFAAAGYRGVVLLLILLAASGAALAWVWVRRMTGSVAAATFAWAATALSVPYLGSSGTIYPEIPASLAVIIAASMALGGTELGEGPDATTPGPSGIWPTLALGLSTASLPWFHAKYALMSAALLAIGLRRIWARQGFARADRAGHVALASAVYAASIVGWMSYFYVIWGSPWPSAAYGGAEGTQMSLRFLGRGVAGLLVDQEYGVLSYAPALGIGLIGLWSMWRAGGRVRTVAIELAVALAALVMTIGAFRMWWGGTALPGRMIVSGILLLAPAVAWEFRASADRPERRAAYRLLLLTGLAVTLASITARNGALLALRRDGISRLLEWLSPDWHLWAVAPDFIMQGTWLGLLQTCIWAVAVLASAWAVGLLARRGTAARGSSRTGRGLAFLRADAGALLAVVMVTVVMPLALGSRLKPNPAPEDRARVEMLESFDPHARPIAIRYTPFSRVEPTAVPTLFVLSARPGSRSARQPVPLLLNARFALPAGRYDVELTPRPATGGAGLTGRLALQVGRTPGSLTEWDIEEGPGARWRGTFDLPVGVNFVGFRAPASLNDEVSELRIRPQRVVPMLDRIAAYDVLAATTLTRFVFLFHDESAYPETDGFWVRGSSPAIVSVVSRTGRVTTNVRLRVRSPVANTVRIDTPGESRTIRLVPNEVVEFEVQPTPLDGTLRMTIRPASGFRPSDLDPRSQDRRFLGCWVEVVG